MNYLIFNDLSSPFTNKYEAGEGLKVFIETFAAASRFGLNQLRLNEDIGENLYNLELAPGYQVSHWLNEHTRTHETGDEKIINDDLKERFKDIFTNTPLITGDEPIEKEINERSTFEISLQQEELKEAKSLGAAFLLDTVALSFLSISFWDTHQIKELTHYFIKDDGNAANEFVQVRHASRAVHFERHAEWLDKKKRDSLKEARNLWEKRQDFFPHLVLCGCIEHQLTENIGIGSKYFNQIITRLKSLDAFAKDWKTGRFNDKTLKKYGLNVSGESDITIRKYGRERRFRLPGGGRAIFQKHIKTGNLRFHFYPDEKNHLIYVGYIGPHLRTATG